MAQFPRLLEAIKLATPDEAEESIGWYAVREKDDAVGGGPYKSYSECVSAMKHNTWFKTHGGPSDKIYYIEHGYVNDDDKFVQQDEDK